MIGVSKEQIKAIYTMGNTLGIVESGNSSDDLHCLVEGITGKDSVSRLTSAQATTVIKELKHRLRFESPQKKQSKQRKTTPKGMTAQQQSKVWALMYELEGYDIISSGSSIGKRLTGIIKKELKTDAAVKNPFAWLNASQGEKLIEILKSYIKSAIKHYEKHMENRGASDG